MSRLVYRSVNDLKGFSLKNCPSMPEPGRILMCPHDHYYVVDVKHPYMAGKVGTVNRNLARRQWEGLQEAFMAPGKPVTTISSAAGPQDIAVVV